MSKLLKMLFFDSRHQFKLGETTKPIEPSFSEVEIFPSKRAHSSDPHSLTRALSIEDFKKQFGMNPVEQLPTDK